MTLEEGTRFLVLSPIVRAQKGRHEKVFADAKKSGYVRVRVDGNMSVFASHEISKEIERALRARFGERTAVAIHIEPMK